MSEEDHKHLCEAIQSLEGKEDQLFSQFRFRSYGMYALLLNIRVDRDHHRYRRSSCSKTYKFLQIYTYYGLSCDFCQEMANEGD